MKIKTRKQKLIEYEDKYSHIPIDYNERLSWLYDSLNITEKQGIEIINKRNYMMESLAYKCFKVVLYEEPEGSPRPRFRLVNRMNLHNEAMSNSSFVHVYSMTGKEDNMYMKRLMSDQEFNELDQLICTPCTVEYCTYSRTPKSFNKVDTFLSEIGLIRPIAKSDFDNIAKKYSDMYNHNIWLDDIMVIDGSVHKYYSVLPRVEINLYYLNMVYNKFQYDRISNRKDFTEEIHLDYYGGTKQ